LNKQFSQYLDLLRIAAAILVLLAHISHPAFTNGALLLPDQIGYSSVMIFFVLSGYVITYVACERESTLLDFSISRFSRVYSVVIPAIVLTASVDVLIINVTPFHHALELRSSIPNYQYAGFTKYLIMSVLFGNQAWGLRESLFSNSAYWSMCFEVYYYVLFATMFYFRGAPRIVLVTIALMFIGPAPLLRFDLWLLGAGTYLLHRHVSIEQSIARAIFVLTIALMLFDLCTDLNLQIDRYLDSMTGGAASAGIWRRFVGDTLTGAIVAANLLVAKYCGFKFGKIGPWFTYLGSISFTLYLMHVPLLRFFSGYFDPRPIALLTLVLGSAWLLSRWTEKQKDNGRANLRSLSARFLKAA
jgi:peptidoglycan/LPS O-acetylase OafA/YrhL